MKFDNNLKLCYCTHNWAYFTTCPLDKQWGDDWNDVPWEHNAGEPYEWAEHRDVAPYNVIKVAWDGPFLLPGGWSSNSCYSVEMINRGDVAWLAPDYAPENAKPIPAGTTLEEFIKRINTAGGSVYLED